jgi:hypothetical protein
MAKANSDRPSEKQNPIGFNLGVTGKEQAIKSLEALIPTVKHYMGSLIETLVPHTEVAEECLH